MKHFLDIQVAVEVPTELKAVNTQFFVPGDTIQITEKIDGSNVSIQKVNGKLEAYSRRMQLDANNSLNGFYDYVQTLDPNLFDENYVVFGEWLIQRKLKYNDSAMYKWYVYDMFDLEADAWVTQDIVKEFCNKTGLTYIHVFYEGPFISWEHCKTFLHDPMYGDKQEGIVIKNQTKLNAPYSDDTYYLKIVNQEFKETKAYKAPKTVDEIAAEAQAQELAKTIITERRIEKMIFNLQDDGILPATLTMKDMKIIGQNLPKRVYDDCLKEEPETVKAIDDLDAIPFGKICGSLVMKMVKQFINN